MSCITLKLRSSQRKRAFHHVDMGGQTAFINIIIRTRLVAYLVLGPGLCRSRSSLDPVGGKCFSAPKRRLNRPPCGERYSRPRFPPRGLWPIIAYYFSLLTRDS